MRVLLLGANGQVGHELKTLLPGEVVAFDRRQCDLADAAQLASRVREAKPQLIVNAAAYTAVDRAESEPALAFAVNAKAPALLAEEAKRLGACLVHYSTDYVFDGAKAAPYVESDAPNPLQAYGRSKLEGERSIVAAGCRYLILRAGWIYADRGKNFVLTMLDKARKGERLRIVDDQHGAPTWALDIATLTAKLLAVREPPEGIFHGAAAGETTWFDFAREIFRLAGVPARPERIATADYPVRTPRPPYTALDSSLLERTTGVPAIGDWRTRFSAFNDLKILRNLGGLAEHDRG